MLTSLNEIYQKYSYPEGNGDKGTCHNYIVSYEKLLKPYRKNGNILEIGISWGYSLRMWREYFLKGMVAGIDIYIESNAADLLTNPNYKIINCDATSPEILDHLAGLQFDVIIDDGSHFLDHQLTTFDLLQSHVKSGGLYIIEDIIDIDTNKDIFLSKHNNCEIIDTRHVNGRYDDVLVVYKF
jgi:cephalosporin hydroxylase